MSKTAVYPPLNAAQQTLVRDNYKFVYQVASSFRKFGHHDDLVSEGFLGLCIAATKFDPARNLRFTTYSVHWIRACIFAYLLRTHCQMHILSSDRRVFFGILKAHSALKENPDDLKTLADKLGVPQDTIALLSQRVFNRDFPLDAPPPDGFAPIEMPDHEALAEDRYAQEEEQAGIRAYVERALATLNPRERRIIESRVMADKPRTLKQLGRRLGGVSRERVRQLQLKAIRKLRVKMLQAGLPPLLATASATPATTTAPAAATPQERARRA